MQPTFGDLKRWVEELERIHLISDDAALSGKGESDWAHITVTKGSGGRHTLIIEDEQP